RRRRRQAGLAADVDIDRRARLLRQRRPCEDRNAREGEHKGAHQAMPSLAFRMSLTAAGLALPWVSFITWPTNQPIAWGLSFTAAALSGLAAIRASTIFSMAPVSLTCTRPCFSTMALGLPSPVPISSNTCLAILDEMTPVSISSTSL